MVNKFVERLKRDRKFLLIIVGVLLAVIFVPYLTIPAIILWWFYRKSKLSKKTKTIITSAVAGLIVVLITLSAIAYAKDEVPHLNVTEPSTTSSVKAQTITIKGAYSPSDRKVWVNGKEVAASNGSFETVYSLKEGENKIDVSAGNWKRTDVYLTITRELTDAEKAARITPTITPKPTSTPTPANKAKPTATPTKTEDKSAPTKVPVKATAAPIQAKQSSETVSQKNAVRKAQSYISFSGFSHDGLVDQLEYEQFSHEDAVYGADNSGANWNEQAAKKAKSYMENSAFSRGSLIEQLKYEKFTQEQAEYGANAVGL